MSDNREITLSRSLEAPNAPTVNHDILSLDELERQLKSDRYRYKSDRYYYDTLLRIGLALWVVVVDTLWLYRVLDILVWNTQTFQISDSVLLMLLGTTTINVIGLAYIVLKGLFEVIDKTQIIERY